MERAFKNATLSNMSSSVDGYTFSQPFSNFNTYLIQSNSTGLNRIKLIVLKQYYLIRVHFQLLWTLLTKKAYYGAFKGEFGHAMAHNIPFLMYLHKKKVRIVYCGLELHKPFLIDEQGNSIIHTFVPLRDFFQEVAPNGNATRPPQDIQNIINAFSSNTHKSIFPFWNINNDFYYSFIHREFLLKGYTHIYNLDKVYKNEEIKACTIFPRSKGAISSWANGEEWDYVKIIEEISPFFDKVYICGHPAQSKFLDVSHVKNAHMCVGTDNAIMLQCTSNSQLIITQHSGVVYIGEYVNTQVLIIYKGVNRVEDIGSINNTLKFRKGLGNKYPLNFAFNYQQIKEYASKFGK
jgi:hypothetical protein